MKNVKMLGVVLIVSLSLMSCGKSPDVKNEVTKNTKIPQSVYSAMNDTTLKPKYIVVETNDAYYLVNKTNPIGVAEAYYDKESEFIGGYIIGVILALFIVIAIL